MTLKDAIREDAEIASAEVAFAPPKVDVTKINTLHELLALAIGDFEKVLADKRYVIDMGDWHLPLDNGKCSVCLAGSVLAKSLNAPIRQEYFFHMDDEVNDRLDALDRLRLADLTGAWDAIREYAEYPLSLEALEDKWSNAMVGESFADNRRDGRKLLAKLKLLQKDLADAGV